MVTVEKSVEKISFFCKKTLKHLPQKCQRNFSVEILKEILWDVRVLDIKFFFSRTCAYRFHFRFEIAFSFGWVMIRQHNTRWRVREIRRSEDNISLQKSGTCTHEFSSNFLRQIHENSSMLTSTMADIDDSFLVQTHLWLMDVSIKSSVATNEV